MLILTWEKATFVFSTKFEPSLTLETVPSSKLAVFLAASVPCSLAHQTWISGTKEGHLFQRCEMNPKHLKIIDEHSYL